MDIPDLTYNVSFDKNHYARWQGCDISKGIWRDGDGHKQKVAVHREQRLIQIRPGLYVSLYREEVKLTSQQRYHDYDKPSKYCQQPSQKQRWNDMTTFMSRWYLQQLYQELEIWRTLNHKNILQLHGVVFTTSDMGPGISIVTPWTENGTLDHYIRSRQNSMTLEHQLGLINDVADGLSYLHSQSMIHRRLRSHNIFVRGDGTACLGGLCRSVLVDSGRIPHTTSKSPPPKYVGDSDFRWMPPEIVTRESSVPSIECDIYSFGNVMYFILSGLTPFHGSSSSRILYCKGLGRTSLRPTNIRMDDHWGLIQKCWRSPKDRPVISEVLHCIREFREDESQSFYTCCTSSTAPPSTPNVPSSVKDGEELFPSVLNLTGQVKVIEHDVYQGGCAVVHCGEWSRGGSKCKVAVKTLRLSDDREDTDAVFRRRLAREVRVWHRLDHINIVKLYGISYSKFGRPTMIIPWYEHGTATSYLRKISGSLVTKIMLINDIARGLTYLHTMKPPILHGDLKANNVLITDEGHAALSDFGLSRIVDEAGFTSTGEGPLRWQAPEVISGDSDNDQPHLTTASDVWSFSCTAYELLTDQIPYYQYAQRAMHPILKAILGGVMPLWEEKGSPLSSASGELRAQIERGWAFQACDRPSMSQMASGLETILS